MSGTTGHQAHGAEDTLKDFWATRPRRPRRGRKIAGVAAAIGNRYGIDPIIVRVAFVVATFYGGTGIVLYLLGWLLLPEQDDEVSPFESMINKGRSSTSTGFTVLLCLALIPTVGWFLDGGFFFPGFITLALAGVALYLLHRSRGHLNRPAPLAPPAPDIGWAAAPPTMPMTAAPTDPASATTPVAAPAADATAAPATGEPTRPTGPPAWDPLGAAPFAWDLPAPGPPAPEPPARRRRSKVGPITVGIALVVLGISAHPASELNDPWFTPPHIIGLLLGVIGAGLFVGSFVRGGRGLIGLAVPLSVVGIAMTTVQFDDYHGMGEITERPDSISVVRSSYELSLGAIELDLSGVRETAGELTTRVQLDSGDVVVVVPQTADVQLDCHVDLGAVDCLGRTADGGDATIQFTEENPDLGSDGKGGLKIELEVEAGLGSVEVRRG